MALRDTRSQITSIAAGSYLDILPTGTEEWVIHNITHEAEAALYFYDGANNLLVDTDTAGGGWLGYNFHCTAGHYYRVKNNNAGAKLIGYDGILSHV